MITSPSTEPGTRNDPGTSIRPVADGCDRLQARSSVLAGEVCVPGDKSMSHRAVILGALARGDSRIDGLLESDDVMRTVGAVRAFGAAAERAVDGSWRVTGARWRSPPAPINCGNSGTAARLLVGAAAGFPLEATFCGDASLGRRPMGRVCEPLRVMGAQVEGDTLPLTIRGGGLRGIRFVNATASAQAKSAILLAGLNAAGRVEVVEPARSRDHSETMLAAFGCEVERDGDTVRLGAHRTLSGIEMAIPGDPSSAAFPLVAALVAPASQVTVRSAMISPLRAGLIPTLDAMGARLRVANRRTVSGEEVADIYAESSALTGVDVPAARAPSMIDEYPILAVAAAFAEGPTVMHGLAELRVKESDRLAAVVEGLRACGVEAREEGDTLIVHGCGGPPDGGADVAAHDDHRIAMSFLILGLGALAPVRVDSAGMIATSFPGFVPLISSIGGHCS